MLAILFQEKTQKKMLVFPKNAEKNASTIEKGLHLTEGFVTENRAQNKLEYQQT